MKKKVLDAFKKWLNSDMVDRNTKDELAQLDEDQIKAAFESNMSFGTAGLRAVMGPGIARMNVYTVAHYTRGVAELISAEGDEAMKAGVVIAHDSRNNSRSFACRAAEVLSACGIHVYIFDALRPTPVLSFAVRRLGCTAGINITASHNSKEYNGYKLYWSDGSQIDPEQARIVSETTERLDIFRDVPSPAEANADLIEIVPAQLDEDYLAEVMKQAVNPEVIRQVADNLTVVYTPLHGTGAVMVPEILRRCGMKHLLPVEKQIKPDGDFPTTPYPNPENADVFNLGVEIAREHDSDLIIATDPDADRVGTMVRDNEGSFRTVTGNQMGALLLNYIIKAYQETGTMPDEPFVVKSFVSTPLAEAICRRNGVEIKDVLTGFKYIGGEILAHERMGHGSFIFGFEESYGYLKGTYARDKDAVVATMLICEMAAYYESKGMTLFDALQQLYAEYGFYRESTLNVVIEGLGAAEKMKQLMNGLRSAYPNDICGSRVIEARDYQKGIVRYIDGTVGETGLPTSDALYFITEEGVRIIIRPSGTEPKVKASIMARASAPEDADRLSAAYREAVLSLLRGC